MATNRSDNHYRASSATKRSSAGSAGSSSGRSSSGSPSSVRRAKAGSGSASRRSSQTKSVRSPSAGKTSSSAASRRLAYGDGDERIRRGISSANRRIARSSKRRRRRRYRVQPRAIVFFAIVLLLALGLGFLIAGFTKGKIRNPLRGLGMREGNVIEYVRPDNVLAANTPEEWLKLENAQRGKVDPHISILMIGDMLMHLNVTKSGFIDDAGTQKNYDAIFANVKDVVQNTDISIVNQEIMMGGEDLGYSGYPMFNTADELAGAIHDAGFNVVLHATNHTMDKWKVGLLHTMEVWKQYPDIKVLGINETKEQQDEIYVYEKDGMKIALLNYTYGLNGMPLPDDMPFGVNLMDEDLMDRNIKKAHEVADFVVILIHWGNEYQTYASDNQKMWCRWFLDRDVDLIIGAHPHVIQPIEWYENESTGHKMLVYYSMGNFITGTRSTNPGTGEQAVGGMAKVELTRDENGNVVIENYGIEPTVAHIDVRGGHGSIYTKFLKDYTEEDIKYNSIARQDPNFTIQMCKDLCRKVWGDLYIEE